VLYFNGSMTARARAHVALLNKISSSLYFFKQRGVEVSLEFSNLYCLSGVVFNVVNVLLGKR